MNLLDMRTVMAAQLITGGICALMLGLLWRNNRERYEGLHFWFLDFILHSAGMLLLILRGAIPDFISILGANTLIGLGMAFLYAGLSRFFGRAGLNRANIVAMAAFILAQCYFTCLRPSFGARTLNINLLVLFFAARSAWLLFSRPLREYAAFTRPAAYALVALALLTLARLVPTLSLGGATDLFHSNPYDSELFLLYSGILIWLTFGLFLMVNRRLRADTRADYEGRMQSEAKFSLIFRQSPFPIVISRLADGQILDVNEAYSEISGYTREETLGRTSLELNLWTDKKERAGLASELGAGRTVRHKRLSFRRKTGEIFASELTAGMISLDGERLLVLLVQDVSELRKAEAALQSAQRFEALGTLAGGLAHDFNNLLTGLTGNLSLLRAGRPGDWGEIVAESETACQAARGLARQLLTFATGGEPVKVPLDLAALARESAVFSLRGSNAVCRVAGAQKIMVEADRDQLFQVVQNLARNAAEAMPGSGTVGVEVSEVELKAGDIPHLAPGAYARLAVSDTGAGISPEDLPKIFDLYFSTKGKGRGLGLSVCRSIARRHGGELAAASSPGGSIFTLYLPLTEKTETPVRAAPAPCKQHCGRVLVMDDGEIVYKALRRMLTSLGYEVEIAVNGERALEAWQAARAAGRPFSVVIMDLTIAGGMGGAEAIKRLKALDPEAKAIVSSGYADDAIMAGHAGHGFAAVLPKPYRLDELDSVLSEVLA